MLEIVGMPQARRSFARSFVDWNEWSTDPGRAFGHTTMNIASLFVGTEGILGKAGEVANAAKTTSSIGRTMSLDDLVRDVNPKYGSGPRYGHNCTHCVQATALRLRGVRTEARPLPKDLPEDEGRPLDVVEQPWATWFYRQSRAEIERSLLARGHGADGVVYVAWQNSKDAHVFNAVNVDGKIRYIDGQNAVVDVSRYFQQAKPDEIWFANLDQLPSTRLGSKYVKDLWNADLKRLGQLAPIVGVLSLRHVRHPPHGRGDGLCGRGARVSTDSRLLKRARNRAPQGK